MKNGESAPRQPPHRTGWSRRLRALFLLPTLLSPAGVLIYGVEYYRQYDAPNLATDYRLALILGLAAVCLLSLAPALIVVLPRRLSLASAIAGSLLGLPLSVTCGLAGTWSGPLLLLIAGFGYVPALAVFRSIRQAKEERRQVTPREERRALHVVKASMAGIGLALATLFLAGLVLLAVVGATWTAHTTTTKTSPDGQWSLVIDTYDEGALGGSTSVTLRSAKDDDEDTMLYDDGWVADSAVRWGKGGAVLIGGRVLHPLRKEGVTSPSPAPQ